MKKVRLSNNPKERKTDPEPDEHVRERRARLEPIYAPPGPDGIVVYAGELEVRDREQLYRARGQLELHLFPEVWFGVPSRARSETWGESAFSP